MLRGVSMTESHIKLSFRKKTGDYIVSHNGFNWISDGRKPYIILRKKVGKKYVSTIRTFGSALKKDVQQFENKIVCRYGDFVAFGKKLPFTLVCTAEITGMDSVTFSLKAENESGYDIQAVYFPAPFNSEKKGETSYHVDVMRQGFLLPDGYRKNFTSTFALTHYLRKINAGDYYVPFWGRVCDGHGFCAIVETPYDACIFSSFAHHQAFVNSVHWCSSLGQLRYERKLRFVFHDECDYNTIAKDYRRYLIETNQFVSLETKIKKNPNIEKLLGSPVLHHKIFAQIQPKSQFYDKDGTNSLLYATFGQRAEEMKKIKACGLDKLYIHTDGWGEQGYDNQHPYILPPCPDAGGWDGMKTLADTCRELGYVFALHDQYRDYYYTSPVFDMEKAVTEIDGKHPYCSIWDGGEHSVLCATQAPAFVAKTYTELEEHGIDVQGVYLDVFSIFPGDECFHPQHRISREESIRWRGKCFDYLNDKGIIMSSEEPGMQLLDKLALVHHGPHMARPVENGEAVGIPVPLASLVYHDCVMIPWNWWNNWGIPKGEDGDLYCAMHAGMPYLHPYVAGSGKVGTDNRSADMELLPEEELKREIERVRPLAALQAKLWNQEMVRHEFLGSTSRQRTTYADGTQVTVDFERDTYEVSHI